MKKTLLFLFALVMLSCEEEGCPEGTFEWEDAQGNLIDCIDIPTFNKQEKQNTFIVTKQNIILIAKLEALK